MQMPSKRLEHLFGPNSKAINSDHIKKLVSVAVEEDVDLDFKSSLYGGESERRDLCRDVAALANTAGGVLLLGIRADEQSQASACPGVALSDETKTRMQQILAGGVMPLPTFEILAIPSGPDSRGFYAIVVAPSPGAPHAVILNEAFHFPIKDRSSIRHASEPEVAEAGRPSELVTADARLEEVFKTGTARLDTDEYAWTCVAMVPEVLGRSEIASATHRSLAEEAWGKNPLVVELGHTVISRVSVGRDRFSADGGAGDESRASWISYDLHSDGAGFFAIAAGAMAMDEQGETLPPDREGCTFLMLDDEFLAIGVLSGLRHLAQHAVETSGLSGPATIKAGVHGGRQGTGVMLTHTRQYPGSPPLPYPPGHALYTPVDVESVATLDALNMDGPELVAVAAQLCNGIGQSFGRAEIGQLSAEGAIRRQYFGGTHKGLVMAWAESASIPILDTGLQRQAS
jgi:hypothetical protein